jgi:hypothetical protein
MVIKAGLNQQSLYQTVTNSRPWRWTMGRVSCAARLPILGFAALLQGAKIVLKSPFGFAISCFDNKTISAMSAEGVKRDSYMLSKQLDGIEKALEGVIVAPSKDYSSLGHSILASCDTVFLGDYHTGSKTVKEMRREEDRYLKYKTSHSSGTAAIRNIKKLNADFAAAISAEEAKEARRKAAEEAAETK